MGAGNGQVRRYIPVVPIVNWAHPDKYGASIFISGGQFSGPNYFSVFANTPNTENP